MTQQSSNFVRFVAMVNTKFNCSGTYQAYPFLGIKKFLKLLNGQPIPLYIPLSYFVRVLGAIFTLVFIGSLQVIQTPLSNQRLMLIPVTSAPFFCGDIVVGPLKLDRPN